MKKKMLALLLSVALTLGLSAPAIAAEAPDPVTAYASTQTVLVDGTPIEFQTYALKDENGNDTNYIKLRDLALILNGTSAQFEVGWDGSVTITTEAAYTPLGSELSTPFSGNRTYEPASAETKVNGQAVPLQAILLKDDSGNGYTYYKLRDLGEALGFMVDWTQETGILVSTENEFFNDQNNIYEQDKVSVRPRHVYWEDGRLVAECFVINGTDYYVSNINVDSLDFSTENGTAIASGSFAPLENVILGSHEHILWTFIFEGDAVQTAGAPLESLAYHSYVGFDYSTELPLAANSFFNGTNNIVTEGEVTIRPRYVYWENGSLVAQCYAINGLDHTVYDLGVEDLSFADANGAAIASATFGGLNDVRLLPRNHILWTFRFPADCVYAPNADLSVLRFYSSVSYNP